MLQMYYCTPAANGEQRTVGLFTDLTCYLHEGLAKLYHQTYQLYLTWLRQKDRRKLDNITHSSWRTLEAEWE